MRVRGRKMNISDMFEKPIDRDIKGVIKVGQHDEANIYQELNEYVVTKELSKHFREFFENYRKGIEGPTDDMGVWISGFFGSGKSHFLKILSYILDNREAKGRNAIDFFRDDNKIDDPLVIADMSLAENVSTDVILFNIDAKAAGSQRNKDPLLDVFLKVFNEMQGFCGEIPFLAELERKLSSEGRYEEFKREFHSINGDDWQKMREDFFFIQDEVIKTLSKINYMSEESARTWAEKADQNYSISIEKFAKLVKEYCKSKGDNHHLVFLVDEIGQYIGDNSKLMLNLQTITEDLGVLCQGKAWIIVTSQQDIDSIMKVKGNDFSKIQGRFKTRLSLSSANVDEVIRKRILSKNETANQTLESLYEEKEAILKNLISFSSDTSEKKMYTNGKDFAAVYPFIPYQFNLLGSVLNSIRIHGASGKHLSEGERSMLALFQESAVVLKDKELGVLMPFNIFYNALHKFIDHTHSSVISHALENDKLDEFDVEVLKVLFMIKYVKEIKANRENLTTLMISNIDHDRVALMEKIENSLQRLVRETLVQKNGDIYSFLTNEEQEINIAIKHENVEMGEIINEASTVIFEGIFTDKKYRYSNRYNFPFNQAVDDRYRGNRQSANMGLMIITPYYNLKEVDNESQSRLSDQSASEKTSTILRGLSNTNNEVIVHLKSDSTFLEEIEGLLKIEKYLTKQSAESSTTKSIRHTKQEEVSEKKARARLFIGEALKEADIYVKGDKVDIKEKNPVDRINDALNKLVKKIYHKLTYMKTAPVNSDIINILRDNNQEKFGKSDNVENSLAIEEMDKYIETETQMHAKPSMKTIINKFNSAPYGFVDLDIEWLIATLYAQKRIYLVKNALQISLKTNSAEDILRYLTKREFQEKILIDKKKEPKGPQIKIVKEVLRDFFDVAHSPEDTDNLMELFHDKSTIRFRELEDIEREYMLEERYPGKTTIQESMTLLRDVNGITQLNQFFDYVTEHEKEFLDICEDLESILSFFGGTQKDIFRRAYEVTDLYNDNKNYIDNSELMEMANSIKRIIEMHNPFSNIHELPELYNNFNNLHQSILEKEAEPIRKGLEDDLKHVLEELDSDDLKNKFGTIFQNRFQELETKLNRSQKISDIQGIQNESYHLANKCLDQIKKFRDSTAFKPVVNNGNGKVEDNKPRIKPLNIRAISKPQITIKKEEDIDEFLESLRKKLKEKLEKDTIINLRI